VDFVRQYQKIDGFWLLLREEASTNVRIYGKEILTIDYHDYTVNGTEAVLPSSSQPMYFPRTSIGARVLLNTQSVIITEAN
jgi:hypothetical protein